MLRGVMEKIEAAKGKQKILVAEGLLFYTECSGKAPVKTWHSMLGPGVGLVEFNWL